MACENQNQSTMIQPGLDERRRRRMLRQNQLNGGIIQWLTNVPAGREQEPVFGPDQSQPLPEAMRQDNVYRNLHPSLWNNNGNSEQQQQRSLYDELASVANRESLADFGITPTDGTESDSGYDSESGTDPASVSDSVSVAEAVVGYGSRSDTESDSGVDSLPTSELDDGPEPDFDSESEPRMRPAFA